MSSITPPPTTREYDVAFIAAAVGATIGSRGDVGPWVRIVPCDLADEAAACIDKHDPVPAFLKVLGEKWLDLHREHYVGCTHVGAMQPITPERTAIEKLHASAGHLIAELQENDKAQAGDFWAEVREVDDALAAVEREFKIKEQRS